jgi:NAD(P)-dependent dehydrogenase (short-subunit alcohol dehydrogenase family)
MQQAAAVQKIINTWFHAVDSERRSHRSTALQGRGCVVTAATTWAKDNIQVNAVLPGWIDTDLTQNARKEVSGLNSMVLMRTPARRWGVPDDLSGIAVFLASAASDFITGTAIPVDGGYSTQV